MTFVPDNLNVLNYPIETIAAKALWASKHKCNKMKAIIAFSLDEANANDNLRRYGYTRAWRQKALSHYYIYANQPDCANIPLTPLSTPWWECMPDFFPDYEVPNTGDTRWIVSFNKDAHVDIPEWAGKVGDYFEYDLYLPNYDDDEIAGLISSGAYVSVDKSGMISGKKTLAWSISDNIEVFVNGTQVTGYRTTPVGPTPNVFRMKTVITKDTNSYNIVKCLGANELCTQPLKGSITNIRFVTQDGSDDRFYPGYIDGDTKPTSTTFVDVLGGKDGTIKGSTGDIWKTRTSPYVQKWVLNYTGTGKVKLPTFVGMGKVSHKVVFDKFPSSTVNDGATDTYFAVNASGNFYWSGFSDVKINGQPAIYNMSIETGVEYLIEGTLQANRNITEISGYGGDFNLKGTVYDLVITNNDGTGARYYEDIISSDTMPTATTIKDKGVGSKDGTIDNIPPPQWKHKP